MLLSLVFAVMVGGGPLVPATGVPVDVQTTAGTTDENAPVAVPPAGEKAMSYYRARSDPRHRLFGDAPRLVATCRPALVNDYHPWHDGGALTYADRFKK